MKKLFVIILAMLLLSGCAALDGLLPAQTVASETTPSTGKVISPLPTTLDLQNPGDCILAVGFTEKVDAYMNGGRFEIRMDVYEPELFDLVDMAMLAPGDTLVISGKNVLVNTITEDHGAKLINGGFENDGYTFFNNDSGVFYSVGANDRMEYHKIGEITFPVSQDFLLTDNSNLEGKVTYPGDMITEAPNSSAVFYPDNTRAHIANGYVESITVEYLP